MSREMAKGVARIEAEAEAYSSELRAEAEASRRRRIRDRVERYVACCCISPGWHCTVPNDHWPDVLALIPPEAHHDSDGVVRFPNGSWLALWQRAA